MTAKFRNRLAVAGAVLASAVVALCAAKADEFAIVPQPAKLEARENLFRITPSTRIVTNPGNIATANILAEKLRVPTGYDWPVQTNRDQAASGVIEFAAQSATEKMGSEGYRLSVETNLVLITAATEAGAFHGAQTLLELLPPEIFSAKPLSNRTWQIPCIRIEDEPRFPWRGFMLDVSRHFFGKEEIKRVLDLMALHKLNTFHWHLTDDQGWRIEIKKYPKLTQVGAWRKHSEIRPPRESADNLEQDNAHPAWMHPPASAFGTDGRYGGFYSQEDVREIVAYAAARHIMIVPEIEIPGHAVAALAAYPELSCDHGSYSTDVDAGINKGVFCAGNDEVFRFLDDVLLEVFELFPGKYIHIGGDEVNAAVKREIWGKCAACRERMKSLGLKNEDELQSWFIRQIENFARAHGKVVIGWSEIAEGGLAKNAVVMDWRGGAMEAATNDQDVVMSPTRFCYLDYYQSLDHQIEPHAFGGFLPLEKVYAFEPIPESLASRYESHILGGQGNLWTEYVASLPHAEYMMFPRLCALAEVGWSPKSARDWEGFSRRLQTHDRRLAELGVNYRCPAEVTMGEWTPAQLTANNAGTNLEWNITSLVTAPGEYRVVFEFEKGKGLTISAASLLERGREVASDRHSGFAGHRSSRPVYVLRLRARDAGATYTLRAKVVGDESFGKVVSVFERSKASQSDNP